MKERDEQVSIDTSRNKIFVPGSGNLPMIGLDRAQLDDAEKRTLRQKTELLRAIRSTWQCTACKQKFPGSVVKVKKGDSGPLMVCPECSGPVVVLSDALNLKTPGGAI
jgi:DNA-directed RNA polymerase subunit RPC12/RpoP